MLSDDVAAGALMEEKPTPPPESELSHSYVWLSPVELPVRFRSTGEPTHPATLGVTVAVPGTGGFVHGPERLMKVIFPMKPRERIPAAAPGGGLVNPKETFEAPLVV